MKSLSLKKRILDYVKSQYPNVVHKGVIGRKAILEWGYENENAGRRCRDLEKEKYVEVIYNEKGEAMYKYIPREEQKRDALTNQDILFHALR